MALIFSYAGGQRVSPFLGATGTGIRTIMGYCLLATMFMFVLVPLIYLFLPMQSGSLTQANQAVPGGERIPFREKIKELTSG